MEKQSAVYRGPFAFRLSYFQMNFYFLTKYEGDKQESMSTVVLEHTFLVFAKVMRLPVVSEHLQGSRSAVGKNCGGIGGECSRKSQCVLLRKKNGQLKGGEDFILEGVFDEGCEMRKTGQVKAYII